MKPIIFRLTFTLLTGFLALIFALPWSYFGIHVPFSGPDYKLGLDLQGGIELDYKIDLEEVRKEEGYNSQREASIIEGLKSVVEKRIGSLNINDSTISSASYGEEEHIIVQIPLKANDALQNSANIQRAKEAIGKVVKIEFKEVRDAITEADREERKKLAQEIFLKVTEKPENFLIETQRFANTYEKMELGSTENIKELFTQTGTEVKIWENWISTEIVSIKNAQDEDAYMVYEKEKNQYHYIIIAAEPSMWKPAMDSKGRVLNDAYFSKASVQLNEAFQPMIELTFNNEGAEIFWELTKRLIGQPIAIFVWGEMLTAPTVQDAIVTGKAVITGDYTSESAAKLATDINTWVVPAPLYLTSERTIDARLGADSLEKIIYSGIFSFLCILIFLVWVYRVSGFIAGVALLLYIILTLVVLKQFGIVQTLASLGGLVLSIGMAIDANILIFERMKDELRKWKTLEQSQDIGFQESFSAIWDSNITGLIVSLILFIFGINMIKGFGLTLGIGIIVSLFSVYYISRVLLKLLAQTGISQDKFIWKL